MKNANKPATREENTQRENDQREEWTQERAEAVLRRMGLGPVLDETPSEMSKYYVTNTFTEFNNPLAPFREVFAPLAKTDVRATLEKAAAEGVLSKRDDEDAPDTEEERDARCAPVVVKEALRQLLLRKLEALALSPRKRSEAPDALAACFDRLEAELALGEVIEVYAALKDQPEPRNARGPPTPAAPGRSAYRPRD